MPELTNSLNDGDLRSIGKVNSAIAKVVNQKTFDLLFTGLFDKDRLVQMRSADAVEKITIIQPGYLLSHKNELLELLPVAIHIELKWHLAQLMPRLKLNKKEVDTVWKIRTQSTTDKAESRIVRVNSMQVLYDIQKNLPELKKDFTDTLSILERENIPSIKARIKKLRK